jgi:hypothetical protein
LRGGTYFGNYQTYLLGTSSAQITVQPYPGERVTIDGGGITIDGGGYLTIRDIELTNSDPSRTDYRAGGFNVAAPGIKLINNIIHDGGAGIVSNDSGYDDEFYGNLIYNVGWDDRATGLMQGGTGPGVYAENAQGFKRFYSNIIATSFGYGFHIYTAGSSSLANFDVQNNVSFNNGYWTRINDSPYVNEGRDTVNFLFGSSNTPLVGLIVVNNVGYHREQRIGDNFFVGYGGSQNASGTVTGNVSLGGDFAISSFQTLNFSGNTIASGLQSLYHRAATTPVSEVINNNNYYYYGNCNSNFVSNDGGDSFISVAQWKALGYDASSSFSPCGTRPPVSVTLDPNAYDTNRANLIISNLSGSSTVSVNLGSFLNNVDSRFPRLTEPPVAGLFLGAGTSASLTYSLKVPATIEKSNYLGNASLMQVNWFGVGLNLGRAAFVFTVS